MSNNSRSVAITLVRAASRMRVTMDRKRDSDADLFINGRRSSDPLIEDGHDASVCEHTAHSHQSWLSKDLTWLAEIVTSSYLNLLLVTVPLGVYAGIRGWGAVPVFVLNFLALIPLSLILGDITEDLALRFGNVVGGLLNATFGNVIEVIISIAALQRNLFTVVATSLVGSILSNLLLVLGASFFFGGLYYKNQSYNAVSNRASCSLLVLATIGIFIPTLAANIIPGSEAWILPLSRGCAIVLLLTYACFIYFHLYTHPGTDEEEEHVPGQAAEEPMLTTFTALFTLLIITLVVAVHSEYLTGALEEVSVETGLGQAFLGMIVLPIAGNACEHLTAVMVAMKNKMDLSLGIAVGSSLQIALFAIPFVVLAGWATGHDFSLNFDFFSVIILLLAVVQTSVATSDANSHWLQGITLISVYILIALTYFYRS